MTASAQVTVPVLRALLDEARRRNYRSGVLGVRAEPTWSGAARFIHDDVPVDVVPCVSALAVREALLDRSDDSWLVVLTDRDEDDLGAGVLSHLLWHRLRTPDPWDAVRHRFAATGIDPALTTDPAQRELAGGLLATTPDGGWPPAPGGVLTRDHALACVARSQLGIDALDIDGIAVLRWAASTAAVAESGALRELAGDGLTDAVLRWIARRLGAAAEAVGRLLLNGQPNDVLAVGLVAGLLVDSAASQAADDVTTAHSALIRLEPTLGTQQQAIAAAPTWAADSATVLGQLLHDPDQHQLAHRVLRLADRLLDDVDASNLARRSPLLPSGLTKRFAALADALGASASMARSALDVESAWMAVVEHVLSTTDARTPVFRAAVRLARWLQTSDPASIDTVDLTALVERHAQTDGWVDSAVNDASNGVGETDLGESLGSLLAAVRIQRDEHDSAFAQALADHGTHVEKVDVLRLESLFADVVLPLCLNSPVLFLLLDGMSVGVATEVVADILNRATDGWIEALLPGHDRRAAAVAVLPTLTEVSRASLFCGQLTRGGQDVESKGHAALARAYGIGSTLFHKKPLDSSRPGLAVADDVGAAIDNVQDLPLVSCVLNTIDDALDRSDPGGTDWGADTVRNLMPLLTRAHRAGRTVVMTADHGHVVERRQGTMRSYGGLSSGRSRDASTPAADGEILVEGPRVVTPDHRAVLAVDERIRFGPLKAGYHGGASPAEVVVPMVVLVPGTVPDGSTLSLAPPQEPDWWNEPTSRPATVPLPQPPPAPLHGTLSLFDDVSPKPDKESDGSLATAVIQSPTYAHQKSLAPRRAVDDEQVSRLLVALLRSPALRLGATQVAQALGVTAIAVRGAIAQVQALLNVEGYPVLRVDADGSTLVLDAPLLREQFEVAP